MIMELCNHSDQNRILLQPWSIKIFSFLLVFLPHLLHPVGFFWWFRVSQLKNLIFHEWNWDFWFINWYPEIFLAKKANRSWLCEEKVIVQWRPIANVGSNFWVGGQLKTKRLNSCVWIVFFLLKWRQYKIKLGFFLNFLDS